MPMLTKPCSGTSIRRPAARSGSNKKQELKFDPLKEVEVLRRFEEVPAVRRRMAPRRAGAAAGCPRHLPASRSTCSRPAARPAFPRAASRSTTFAPTTRLFSDTLPDKYFPQGAELADARPLAARGGCGWRSSTWPSIRGGICFCIDLDPRWVIKLIKKGWMEHLEAYKQHCIDQALTILSAGHDIKCMFTTPKLLEVALRWSWRSKARAFKDTGITGIFSRRHRVHAAVDALLPSKSISAARPRERHLHDAHLRQHADGPGLLQAGHRRRRLQDQLLRPAAAGRRSKSSISTIRPSSSATAKPAA